MKTERSRRASLITNTIFSLLSWFMPILIGFVATPLIVRKLGNRDYGLYAIILGFISYSFTFGIGRVLIKLIAEYRASGETHKIGEVVSATFWSSLTIAIIGVLIVAVSAKYIVAKVLVLPPEQSQAGEVGLYLACAAIIATMLSQIFQFILQGVHRFGTYLSLTIISGIVLNAGNVGLALLGYGIEALLTWNFIALFIMAAAFGVDAVRHLPEFSLRLNFRSKEWPFVVKYAASILTYQIFGNVLYIFERTWITRRFGTEAATYYLIPMTLAIYLHGIATSSILVVFPLVNELLLDRQRLEMLYLKANKMIVALIAFMATMLVFGGDGILKLWVGQDIAQHSYYLLIIHTLTFALTACLMIIGMMAEGFRFPYFNSMLTVTWVAVVIPVIIFAADRWGLEGIAGARLLGVVLTLPLLFVFERAYFGQVFWRFWTVVSTRILIAAGSSALVLTYLNAAFGLKWYSIVIRLGAGALTYLAVLTLTGYFTSDERQMMLELVFRKKNDGFVTKSK